MSEKVLITGASAGIGAATARLFAEQGDAVALVARRAERLEKVAALCEELGSPRVEIIEADLAEKGAGVHIVERCIEQLGDLNVLILNAGYGVSGPSHDVSPSSGGAHLAGQFSVTVGVDPHDSAPLRRAPPRPHRHGQQHCG